MDYKVTDTELTSIANAIRTKGGTSAELIFPDGFISAVQNIPTGSTPKMQTKSKTYTPTESSQTETVSPDSGYDGLSSVSITVGAIPPGNFVTGTFTTGSSAGVGSVSIPYTGSGYPLMAVVVVDGGAYNSTISPWYSSVQRYAVGQWTMTKAVMTSTPTYTTTGTQNAGVTTAVYKNSTSSSTSYARTSAMSTNVFSSNNASNSAVNVCKLKTGNVLSYYVNTSSYGLLPDTTYRYFIAYSE